MDSTSFLTDEKLIDKITLKQQKAPNFKLGAHILLVIMAGVAGLEPTTRGFEVRRSTIELYP